MGLAKSEAQWNRVLTLHRETGEWRGLSSEKMKKCVELRELYTEMGMGSSYIGLVAYDALNLCDIDDRCDPEPWRSILLRATAISFGADSSTADKRAKRLLKGGPAAMMKSLLGRKSLFLLLFVFFFFFFKNTYI